MVVALAEIQIPIINNFIGSQAAPPKSGDFFEKISPHDKTILCKVARSNIEDMVDAVQKAREAQPSWKSTTPVQRGAILYRACQLMELQRDQIAKIVSDETGKSLNDAKAETDAAIKLGLFYASEGQRLYGRTTTSGILNRFNVTVREPCGVAALVVAANTPIANVAWKTFPALICGNSVVLKAAEDTPMTANIFVEIFIKAGLPAGVLNVLQGLGSEVGAALVEHGDIDLISFTGSTATGKWIGEIAGRRLIKVSLELGGKNAFIVCDDADLDLAVHWAILSAFSNAGQRCAAASRFLIFENIYDEFVDKFIKATKNLKLGNMQTDDIGPVINKRALDRMLSMIEKSQQQGARILCGGKQSKEANNSHGYYMTPTLIENAPLDSDIVKTELFGPIATIFSIKDLPEAIRTANNSPYGLTAAIHTSNYNWAMEFVHAIQVGVVTVNGGTFGSEPHMPFGGLKQSGNGTREPGTEALDIYSELKNVYFNVIPHKASL